MVANGYLTEGSAQTSMIEDLYALLDTIVLSEMENKEMLISVELEIFDNYPDFKTYVLEENARITECRIYSLNNFIQFMKTPTKELGRKALTKDQCLQLWGIPIKTPATTKDPVPGPQTLLEDKSEEKKDDFTVIEDDQDIGKSEEALHQETRRKR